SGTLRALRARCGLSLARSCSYRAAGGASTVQMPACPHCGIWLVKKASRRGLREYLLSLLTLGPFRCQICTHRFLNFTWWPGPDPRREYNRIPVRYPVLLSPTHEHKGTQYEEGTLLDLSIRGCAIKSDVPLHKGDI